MTQFTNEVAPSDPKQIEAMMEPGPDGPIYMVNLLKFKDRAQYEDGRDSDLSGRDAYRIYSDAVKAVINQHGGQMVFLADMNLLALGQIEQLWDEIGIVGFPNRGALLKMSMSEEWQAISVHRAAGLEGQLNIECTTPPQSAELPWVAALAKAFAEQQPTFQ